MEPNWQNWLHQAAVGYYGVAHFAVEFNVICAAHYYGKDCSILCTPMYSTYGHYDCDRDGKKVCMQGYKFAATNCVTRTYVYVA